MDAGGQFCDHGPEYRSAIFYLDDAQKAAAEASKRKLEENPKLAGKIVTQIAPAGPFYPAEEYHQDFAKKNADSVRRVPDGLPARRPAHADLGRRRGEPQLKKIRPVRRARGPRAGRARDRSEGCAHRGLPAATYQKPSAEELKKKLTPLQYHVTQESGTERAYSNAYWDSHDAGIYVDIVSGEPLFSSLDKYDSGTGWPSFTKPLVAANVKQANGSIFAMFGVEVRSDAGELAPRARLRRRAEAGGPALLHQLGGAALRPGRQARRRGLPAVRRSVPEIEVSREARPAPNSGHDRGAGPAPSAGRCA